jgi:hypothetical protein
MMSPIAKELIDDLEVGFLASRGARSRRARPALCFTPDRIDSALRWGTGRDDVLHGRELLSHPDLYAGSSVVAVSAVPRFVGTPADLSAGRAAMADGVTQFLHRLQFEQQQPRLDPSDRKLLV